VEEVRIAIDVINAIVLCGDSAVRQEGYDAVCVFFGMFNRRARWGARAVHYSIMHATPDA
jgi:hypothetical protein